ncbi:hypothetical protein DXY22_03456 [Bacillus subtilis]|nr:hypothetical protein DXY22_03456 [Bacillus subtilis]
MNKAKVIASATNWTINEAANFIEKSSPGQVEFCLISCLEFLRIQGRCRIPSVS